MAELLASADNTAYFSQGVMAGNNKSFPFYGELNDANNYASMHIYWDSWQFATNEERVRALVVSTRAIDRLNYQCQPSGNFGLAFPRGEDTEVPRKVVEACYENAIMILKGLDPETEIRNLSATSQGFSGHTTRFDRGFIPEYLKHGIVSAAAWANLTPFFRDPHSIKIV